MKLTSNKIFSFMLAAAFALTLAGCGGNGGGTAAVPDPDTPVVTPEPTPEDMCAADGGRFEADGTCTPAADVAAEMCTASGGRVEADGMCTSAEERIAEAARNSCVAAGGRSNADGTCTSAADVDAEMCTAGGGRVEDDGSCTSSEDVAEETCIAGGGRSNADGTCTTAAVLATTKAAGTKMTAIAAEAAQTTPDGPGGLAATDDHMVAITRDRMDTKVTITVVGAAADAPEFEEVMDLGVAKGFAGTMNLRAMEENDDGETVEEVMVIRTDIREPKATDFGDVYTLNEETDDESEGDDSLRIITDNAGMLMSSSFSASGAATITLVAEVAAVEADPGNNVEAVEGVDAFEADATFDGAAGTLKCAGTDGANGNCTVTINAKGEVTGATGDLNFTPADKAKVYVAQTDYLYYGFWLQRTQKDGTTYNEVETFYSSNDLEESNGGQLDAVEGGASYKGNATGVYVKNVLNTNGTVDTATSGVFSADADLTVNFMGTSIPNDAHNTVTGSITNFALEKGEDNDWSVALKGTRASSANTISGTANGGGAEGSFSGTLYGESPETEATDDGADRVAPGAVAGEFGANFSNGSVAGAFGAKKQ